MSDDYEFIDEEDDSPEEIASLEDNPAEEEEAMVLADEEIKNFAPDIPVYRLRLSYSNETFLAAFKGELLKAGRMVVVPTRYGRDLAQVIGTVERKRTPAVSEVARIERTASTEDLDHASYNRQQEDEAYRVCKQKIEERKLEMKLVSVHYLLEESKILFFFTAESRVDFRELVKDLVSVFKSRIELRQIGVRDESRVLGGLGICGRPYCCHAVSDKLRPVSIKMAKDQNLSLNSMKISGPCGRLLCCLAYEYGFYSEQRKSLPNEGCKLSYDNAQWKVTEVNAIKGSVKLSSDDDRQLELPASSFRKVDNRWQITP
jgi:cell fate regulator YaaT (PSP1 superfamily)